MSVKQASKQQQPRGSNPITWSRIKASLAYRIASQSFALFESIKRGIHGAIRSRPSSTLFIFGAQRSGTTHLERLFRADPRTIVYSEFSELSIQPDKTVWAPLADVRDHVGRGTGQYAVVRSLLASHRAGEILDFFPDGRAVWLVRPAEEVVNSMLHKWGGRFEEISRRVETDHDGLWDLEPLWSRIAEDMRELSDAAPGSTGWNRDLYGLYWRARNASYFENGFNEDTRISLLSYRSLLSQPTECVRRLVGNIGIGPAQFRFPLTTHPPKAKKLQQQGFSPKIQALCDDLYDRMVQAETRDR